MIPCLPNLVSLRATPRVRPEGNAGHRQVPCEACRLLGAWLQLTCKWCVIWTGRDWSPASRPPPERARDQAPCRPPRDRPAARPPPGPFRGTQRSEGSARPCVWRTHPFLPQPAGREEARLSGSTSPRPRLPLGLAVPAPSLASAWPPGAVAQPCLSQALPASPHCWRRPR